jgi:hypothetical protein
MSLDVDIKVGSLFRWTDGEQQTPAAADFGFILLGEETSNTEIMARIERVGEWK